MIYFKPHHFKASDGSHIPVLIAMLNLVPGGPILELGTGFYSTPLLHWLCAPTKRRLVSYESHPSYYAAAENYRTDWHEVIKVDNWAKAPIEQHWSLALVDHGPGPQRKVEFARLANCADYVIVHDTEPQNDRYYHFSEVAPLYKYRWDYTKLYPNTSVFSNIGSLALKRLEKYL